MSHASIPIPPTGPRPWLTIAAVLALIHPGTTAARTGPVARGLAVVPIHQHRIALVVTDPTALAGRIDRVQVLPRDYRLSEQPFDESTDAAGIARRHHWILYRFRGLFHVAGVAMFEIRPPDLPVCIDAELTNVPWGFDTSTQRFWIAPDAEAMPTMPRRLDDGPWRGLRIAIPTALERLSPVQVAAVLDARGARIVRPDGLADVVLLADDVDFARSRVVSAERLVQIGARVMWERDFLAAARRADDRDIRADCPGSARR